MQMQERTSSIGSEHTVGYSSSYPSGFPVRRGDQGASGLQPRERMVRCCVEGVSRLASSGGRVSKDW
jgi:hypothetical protein